MPSAVVLMIDGLGAKHLGPYGNTWVETQAFNELAVESLLIERLYLPSERRDDVYEAWWQRGSEDLLDQLNQQGTHTQILTDDEALWDLPATAKFAQQDRIGSPEGVRLADDWQDTHTAHFFAQAIQAIEEQEKDSLLWLHFRGFLNPWDAPYAYRQQFVDEDDPDATGSAQVPRLTLDEGYDPDTLHEIQCAHAGQVLLLDECLDVLHQVFSKTAAERQAMLLVSSPAGFPLGEHLQVGSAEAGGSLYHEALSVPGVIRYPDGHFAMRREAALTEVRDLSECLSSWLLHHQVKPTWSQRDHSFLRQGNSYLLRTPTWHVMLRQLTDNSEQDLETAELYLQPDDYNEVNDVSDRCKPVVLAAREWLIERLAAASGNHTALDSDADPIPSILLDPPS